MTNSNNGMPIFGKVYNVVGTNSKYLCTRNNHDATANFISEGGWAFTAHDVRFDEQGRIYWGYSTDGHFAPVYAVYVNCEGDEYERNFYKLGDAMQYAAVNSGSVWNVVTGYICQYGND
jgi:hypothetical protein